MGEYSSRRSSITSSIEGSIATCSHIIAAMKSSVPVAISAITPKVGMYMLAAISMHGRQECPMRRIQATIGPVMMVAITSRAIAGAFPWKSELLVPITRSRPSPGIPSTTMPTNMTTTISM